MATKRRSREQKRTKRQEQKKREVKKKQILKEVLNRRFEYNFSTGCLQKITFPNFGEDNFEFILAQERAEMEAAQRLRRNLLFRKF